MSRPPALTEFDLDLDGRSRHFKLREPATSEVISLVLDRDIRTADLVERRLAFELYYLIEEVDGEEPDWEEAQAWVRNPESLGRLLHARNRLYNHLAEQGRALAFCPHCDGPPAELDLLFYWMTLRLPKWDFFDQGVLMHSPSLSSNIPAGSRPPAPPRARNLAFTYPYLQGDLHSLATAESQAREHAYWPRFAPDDEDPPDDRAHWRRNSPGFRAILRLAVALTPDSQAREVTPAEVDALPLGAFLFADLLHFAAVNVDVPGDSRAKLKCAHCTQEFLPVL
jgi:hypothetical protein